MVLSDPKILQHTPSALVGCMEAQKQCALTGRLVATHPEEVLVLLPHGQPCVRGGHHYIGRHKAPVARPELVRSSRVPRWAEQAKAMAPPPQHLVQGRVLHKGHVSALR